MKWIDNLGRARRNVLFGTLMSNGPLLFYPGPWTVRSVLIVAFVCVFFLGLAVWRIRKSDSPYRVDFFEWCITVGFMTVAYLLSGAHYLRTVLAAVFFWGLLPWVRKEWGLTDERNAS